MEDVEKLLQGLDAQRMRLITDLVARAPQYHARMIAVAVDNVHQVAFMPLVEVVTVPVGADLAFGYRPLIEWLVHDQ